MRKIAEWWRSLKSRWFPPSEDLLGLPAGRRDKDTMFLLRHTMESYHLCRSRGLSVDTSIRLAKQRILDHEELDEMIERMYQERMLRD